MLGIYSIVCYFKLAFYIYVHFSISSPEEVIEDGSSFEVLSMLLLLFKVQFKHQITESVP
ncbi:hypothetical protein BDC45DRAFT_516916 [Circinella umbellata]|nr:hypothetical protein BDC45DRAFT_516916 [Circinella umbellata]